MIAFRLQEVELVEGWVAADPSARGRFAFPLSAREGATSSSLIYFEVAPGDRVLRHTHTAEETLLILEGTAQVEVDGEIGSGGKGSVVLVPSNAPHGLRNTGADTLRVVGFFAAAGMVHTYEAPIAPFDVDVLVTPDPREHARPAGTIG